MALLLHTGHFRTVALFMKQTSPSSKSNYCCFSVCVVQHFLAWK